MRQLALASELRARGASVQFACRAALGGAEQLLSKNGFPVILLQKKSGTTSQEEDAAETRNRVLGHFDWIIVDQYELDSVWERAAREFCDRILAVDDLANRMHDCDVLLDQNYYADLHGRYRNLVSPSCKCLLGASYALLRPEFSALRPNTSRTGDVRRIHISFGATDPARQTLVALKAMKKLALKRSMAIDVIVGRGNGDLERIRAAADLLWDATCHIDTSNMAALMKKADLALGAGGVSSNERMCVGLPAIVVATSPLQERSAKDLDELGAHRYLGNAVGLDPDAYAQAVSDLINNPESLRKMSRTALDQVDGLGAGKVAAAIIHYLPTSAL